MATPMLQPQNVNSPNSPYYLAACALCAVLYKPPNFEMELSHSLIRDAACDAYVAGLRLKDHLYAIRGATGYSIESIALGVRTIAARYFPQHLH